MTRTLLLLFLSCCPILAQAAVQLAGWRVRLADDLRWSTQQPGLPLGLLSALTYAETTANGTSVTFVFDGVPEAADATGEVFGLEPTRMISRASAAAVPKHLAYGDSRTTSRWFG